MRTSRVISNISYNSDVFFETKIKSAVQEGILDYAFWIRHDPDVDETKSHIHFLIKPSKQLDTKQFREYLFEADAKNPKPLTCTTVFFPERGIEGIFNWILYVLHDTQYLASKGQRRNIHYEFEEIMNTDQDALNNFYNQIDRSKYQRLDFLYKAVQQKKSFAALVQEGIIPIAQRAVYEAQYRALYDVLYTDGGRKRSHEKGEDSEASS